jgi:toxin YoeB
MKDVKFTLLSNTQLKQWKTGNKKIYKRIEQLIENIQENPHKGIGKPEPLKHELSGYWSRRITEEHRLVYEVTIDAIIIISCKYHY